MKTYRLLAHTVCALVALTTVSAQTSFNGFVTGTNGTIDLSSGNTFASQLKLTITGNVPSSFSSVNVLLETPTTGVNSGVNYFTVSVTSPSATFDTLNNPASTNVAFNTAGDSFNSGFTVSNPSFDLGAHTSTGDISNNGSNFNGTVVDTVTFTAAPNTPAGTYNFYSTLGPFNSQGTTLFNTAGSEFDENSNPVFTITVVPEPTTLALLGLGGLALFGLRRRSR